MRLLLSLLLCASCALAAEHPEILFCLFERTGVLYDQLYEDPPTSLNCGNMTYCQKITANYISVGDKRTHIVLKGCDGIEIPKVFYGPKCQKEGCSEISVSGEKYQLCCCKGDQCNSSSGLTIFPLLLTLSLLFISTQS
ncbi:hypothetical protein PRIPAC_70573 [Pristionchus pacificus]|uniref:Uncharacterized protein n=1 Tax=Pristionchus pacificus TaxID=54126 RepID=A0A454XS41_PRIPA|nr:hypothetical protein PRIPAC_70573 [Pristionchus pacificus]|eukprot:PDM68477.1 hypothetical protein PRIPAC_43979 [Pristionchus pacificus]